MQFEYQGDDSEEDDIIARQALEAQAKYGSMPQMQPNSNKEVRNFEV